MAKILFEEQNDDSLTKYFNQYIQVKAEGEFCILKESFIGIIIDGVIFSKWLGQPDLLIYFNYYALNNISKASTCEDPPSLNFLA